MSSVQRIHLGPDTTPIAQGRSAHGRWRYAYQQTDQPPEEGAPRRARLFIIHDFDRLVFALAEGPAAEYLGEHLSEYLWTNESAGADWPQELRDWLADTPRWVAAPPGRTGFVCGRLERNLPGGRIYLAWLGMSGVRIVDRIGDPVTLDTVISADEAWTPKRGPEPVGMALHAYRGSLFGLDRLMIFTDAAEPVGDELPDLANPELRRALEDWGGEAERDLVVFDLRLNPVLTEPNSVMLSYRWVSSDLCELSWIPSASATAYRIEEAGSPVFDDAALVAELTDTRQTRYELSPPATSARYYRVVPLNQGVPGAPSDPVSPTPITLTTPLLDPVAWSGDGGYFLRWTPIAQATSYEVQSSPSPNFEEHDSQIIYRGALAETFLTPDTPPNLYYRVRAINVLYAPQMPSSWSAAQRAPLRLDTPRFIEVTQKRIAWDPVPGARQYVIRVTALGQPDTEGEDLLTTETAIPAADQPATYRVCAFRKPGDQRTASEWSDVITLSPPRGLDTGQRVPDARMIGPLLIGAALVALIVGAVLGWVGLDVIQDYNATATYTPIPQAMIDATATADTINIANATQVAVRATVIARLTQTSVALSSNNATLSAQNTVLDVQNATLNAQNQSLGSANENLSGQNETLGVQNATLIAQNSALGDNNQSLISSLFAVSNENQSLQLTIEAQVEAEVAATGTAAAWTATPTPSDTPDLTQTVEAAVAGNLTATAAQWTPTAIPSITPTPSNTPDLTGTVEAAVAANLTATAAQWTATPTATNTLRPSMTPTPVNLPDVRATVAAEVIGNLTATAASWTATPTPTDTLTPSNTPALEDTADALAAANMTAAALAWTATPTPSQTPDLPATIDATVAEAVAGTLAASAPVVPPVAASPTVNWVATVDAFALAQRGAGCFLVAPPDALPPVYAAPDAGGEPLAAAVTRLVPVTGRLEGSGDPASLWLRVVLGPDGAPVEGWVPLPAGIGIAEWVGGPLCDLAADVPLVEEG